MRAKSQSFCADFAVTTAGNEAANASSDKNTGVVRASKSTRRLGHRRRRRETHDESRQQIRASDGTADTFHLLPDFFLPHNSLSRPFVRTKPQKSSLLLFARKRQKTRNFASLVLCFSSRRRQQVVCGDDDDDANERRVNRGPSFGSRPLLLRPKDEKCKQKTPRNQMLRM